MLDRMKLAIIGAGGWGLEAVWVARAMAEAGTADWDLLGFFDDRSEAAGTNHAGIPVLGATTDIAAQCGSDTLLFIAVGHDGKRRELAEALQRQQRAFATLVHPRSEIAADATVGEGSYVGAFATLAPEARVGRHVMINIGVVVGHEVSIGDYSQLAPGAVVTGSCKLGTEVFLGSNASLYPGRTLADQSVVAANSFVIADIEPRQTAMGVPAKPVFQKR